MTTFNPVLTHAIIIKMFDDIDGLAGKLVNEKVDLSGKHTLKVVVPLARYKEGNTLELLPCNQHNPEDFIGSRKVPGVLRSGRFIEQHTSNWLLFLYDQFLYRLSELPEFTELRNVEHMRKTDRILTFVNGFNFPLDETLPPVVTPESVSFQPRQMGKSVVARSFLESNGMYGTHIVKTSSSWSGEQEYRIVDLNSKVVFKNTSEILPQSLVESSQMTILNGLSTIEVILKELKATQLTHIELIKHHAFIYDYLSRFIVGIIQYGFDVTNDQLMQIPDIKYWKNYQQITERMNRDDLNLALNTPVNVWSDNSIEMFASSIYNVAMICVNLFLSNWLVDLVGDKFRHLPKSWLDNPWKNKLKEIGFNLRAYAGPHYERIINEYPSVLGLKGFRNLDEFITDTVRFTYPYPSDYAGDHDVLDTLWIASAAPAIVLADKQYPIQLNEVQFNLTIYNEPLQNVGIDEIRKVYKNRWNNWFSKGHYLKVEDKNIYVHHHALGKAKIEQFNIPPRKQLVLRDEAKRVAQKLYYELSEFQYPNGFTYIYDNLPVGIRQLKSGFDLAYEGEIMKHCIGSEEDYRYALKRGNGLFFHLDLPHDEFGVTLYFENVYPDSTDWETDKGANYWELAEYSGFNNEDYDLENDYIFSTAVSRLIKLLGRVENDPDHGGDIYEFYPPENLIKFTKGDTLERYMTPMIDDIVVIDHEESDLEPSEYKVTHVDPFSNLVTVIKVDKHRVPIPYVTGTYWMKNIRIKMKDHLNLTINRK